VIPESYRTIPGPQGLHGLAAVQFAKRMALDMDLIK
jgi:hypothetical protein